MEKRFLAHLRVKVSDRITDVMEVLLIAVRDYCRSCQASHGEKEEY